MTKLLTPNINRRKKGGRDASAAVMRTPRPASRARLRPRSASMAAKMRLYNAAKEKFLKEKPYCFCCKMLAATIATTNLAEMGQAKFQIANALQFKNEVAKRTKHLATEIHHVEKRGKNLLNVDTWRGICRFGHTFVHDHPAIARKAGLL